MTSSAASRSRRTGSTSSRATGSATSSCGRPPRADGALRSRASACESGRPPSRWTGNESCRATSAATSASTTRRPAPSSARSRTRRTGATSRASPLPRRAYRPHGVWGWEGETPRPRDGRGAARARRVSRGVKAVAVSPDGRRAAAASDKRFTSTTSRAASAGGLPGPREHRPGRCLRARRAPPGLGGDDHAVWLVDAATGTAVRSFAGHEKGVYAVAVSPDGRLVASLGSEPLLLLHELATGKLVRSWSVHPSWRSASPTLPMGGSS